jgi:hypothetical protein
LACAVSEKREALALLVVDVLAGMVVVLSSFSIFFRFLLLTAKAVAGSDWTAAAPWRNDEMEPGA